MVQTQPAGGILRGSALNPYFAVPANLNWLMWLRHEWPYAQKSAYAPGSLFHFVALLPALVGPVAFPFVLILHTVGMGFLVGSNIALDLRVLGVAPRIPLSLFEKLFLIMRISFFINAGSGLLLLIAYPTKALTNSLPATWE